MSNIVIGIASNNNKEAPDIPLWLVMIDREPRDLIVRFFPTRFHAPCVSVRAPYQESSRGTFNPPGQPVHCTTCGHLGMQVARDLRGALGIHGVLRTYNTMLLCQERDAWPTRLWRLGGSVNNQEWTW
jgi:hypothetical protein